MEKRTLFGQTLYNPVSRFVAEIPDEFKEEIQKKQRPRNHFRSQPLNQKGQKSHADQIGLQIGDDVNHDMFGDGVIVKLEVTEYEAVATINFVDEGQRHSISHGHQ